MVQQPTRIPETQEPVVVVTTQEEYDKLLEDLLKGVSEASMLWEEYYIEHAEDMHATDNR